MCIHCGQLTIRMGLFVLVRSPVLANIIKLCNRENVNVFLVFDLVKLGFINKIKCSWLTHYLRTAATIWLNILIFVKNITGDES